MKNGIIGLLLVLLMLTFSFGHAAALEIPIDISNSTFETNGPETMTIHGISALGHTYRVQFSWNPSTYGWDFINAAEETTVDSTLLNAQKLLGVWHFNYAIGTSSYSQKYILSDMDTSEVNSQGGYFVSGVNAYGNIVVASHFPTSGYYSLLDSDSTLFIGYYTFTISGNTASGCYYQIDPSTGQISSSCYPMSGSKSALSSSEQRFNANKEIGSFSKQIELRETEGEEKVEMDPIHKLQYEALKSFYLEKKENVDPNQ